VVSVTVLLSTWKGHVIWLKGLIWYITSRKQLFQTAVLIFIELKDNRV